MLSKGQFVALSLLSVFVAIPFVYFYIYKPYKTSEPFINGLATTQEMCNASKNYYENVVVQKDEECNKMLIDKQNTQNDSRNSINNALSCYNYVGNEIVTTQDVDSWCKLSETDLSVIDEVASKLLAKPPIKPNQFDNIAYKDMQTFNSMDKYSNF